MVFGMNEVSQVTIDRAGRVLIPKEIRTKLGLSAGAKLVIEAYNNKEIRLRLVQAEPQLVNKDGVLVVQSVAVDELRGVEKRERERRLAEILQQSNS